MGITLTAASKVVLMEPTMDPALEAQAAGRIHRLGQLKEVLIKRFAFKGTVEEAIVDLHAAQKAGQVSVRELQDCGGARSVTRNASVAVVPGPVLAIFRAHGVAEPHRCVSPSVSTVKLKQTKETRHDIVTGSTEHVWEWFIVENSVCADCGASVEGKGKCVFRGLASEKSSKERDLLRCETRLGKIAEMRRWLQTSEYRSGRRQLTMKQQQLLGKEQRIRAKLAKLQAQEDQHGVGWHRHLVKPQLFFH